VLLKFLADFRAFETRKFSVSRAFTELRPAVIGQQTAQEVVLDYSPLRLRFPRGPKFSPFPEAYIGRRRVVAENNSGISLVDTCGKLFQGKAQTVGLVENGPIQSIVQADGIFVGSDGPLMPSNALPNEEVQIRFSCWIYATAGTSTLRITFNLHNPGSQGLGVYESSFRAGGRQYSMKDYKRQWLAFRSMSLKMPLPESLPHEARAAGSSWYPVNHSAALSQWCFPSSGFANLGFRSRWVADHFAQELPGKNDGWIQCRTSHGSITVGVAHFWQNWPKAIRIDQNGLWVDLFPAQNKGQPAAFRYKPVDARLSLPSSEHILPGGRWKSHEVLLSFSSASDTADPSVHRELQHPLIGVVDSAYLMDTEALFDFFGHPRDANTLDPPVSESLQHRRRLRMSLVGANTSARSASLEDARALSTRQGWAHLYGYSSYGDLSWRGKQGRYCNLHYDWPYGMLMDFLRYKDIRFFQEGDLMAKYRREWGQYHHQGGVCWADGISWFEATDHLFEPERPRLTHNWNGGLFLHYLLTGEELTRRALIENADGVFAAHLWPQRLGEDLDEIAVRKGTREQGWSILALLNGFDASNDPRYLDLCRAIIQNITLPTIHEFGGIHGFIRANGTLMFGYCIPAFVRLFYTLPKSDPIRPVLKHLIAQIVDGVEQSNMKVEAHGRVQPGESFRPPMYRTPWGKPSVTYSIFYSDALAFLYKEVSPLKGLKQRLYENLYGAFAHQSKREPTIVGDPSTYAPPSFASATGGQASKELGWMGIFGSYAFSTLLEPDEVPALEDKTTESSQRGVAPLER
jgi:hypothetical protein